MAAPTAPYATKEDVALFTKNILRGATNYSSSSVLTDTTIDQYLVWVSAAIDIKLAEAGYVVPLQAVTNETWPTHQTLYLTLLATLGATSLIQPALTPAPTMEPGQTLKPLKGYYETELEKIATSRFRADYYLGTKAETMLVEPATPISNWLEGDIDKTEYMNLTQFTELMDDVNYSIQSQLFKWDYMYEFLNLGYGKI